MTQDSKQEESLRSKKTMEFLNQRPHAILSMGTYIIAVVLLAVAICLAVCLRQMPAW